MSVLTFTDSLMIMTCDCGATYGLQQEIYDRSRNGGKHWYCPNGCQRIATALSEEQKIQREREAAERIRAQLVQNQRYSLRLEHRLRAEKGAKTKLKKRIASGTCPCCHRNFKQLSRHMECKHPEYLSDEK